jgi:hypothetical protein
VKVTCKQEYQEIFVSGDRKEGAGPRENLARSDEEVPVATVEAGCGTTFTIPDDEVVWDVNTEVIDGVEYVVEQHLAPPCPKCGRTADLISKPLGEKKRVKFADYRDNNRMHSPSPGQG